MKIEPKKAFPVQIDIKHVKVIGVLIVVAVVLGTILSIISYAK